MEFKRTLIVRVKQAKPPRRKFRPTEKICARCKLTYQTRYPKQKVCHRPECDELGKAIHAQHNHVRHVATYKPHPHSPSELSERNRKSNATRRALAPKWNGEQPETVRRDGHYEERKEIIIFVICRECGGHYKSLKRHLPEHDFTTSQYKNKWPGAPIKCAEYREADVMRAHAFYLKNAEKQKEKQRTHNRNLRAKCAAAERILLGQKTQQTEAGRKDGGAPVKWEAAFLENCIILYPELKSWGKVALRVMSREEIKKESGVRSAGDKIRLAVVYYIKKRKKSNS
jgi:hypothetical protein